MQKYSLSFKDHSHAAFLTILASLSPIQFKYLYDKQNDFYKHRIKDYFGFNVDDPIYQIPKGYNKSKIKEQIYLVIVNLYDSGELLHTEEETILTKVQNYFKVREYKKLARSITGSSGRKNLENLSYILQVLNEFYIRYGTTTIDYVFFREDGIGQYMFNTFLFQLIGGFNIKEIVLENPDFVDEDDLFELVLCNAMIAIQEGCTTEKLKEKIDAIIKENEALIEG